jgi:two-component system CheB/CheR fusion protein
VSQTSPQLLVVGIGASAGGIDALQAFFANAPAGSGCAYVVILHLSPEHNSQLAAILQTVTELPVTQVTERVRVEPDHIYVVPPNQHLTMVDGEVQVSPNLLPEERRAPIDIFFRTLAESHQGHGVCVILSGTGADGSMGLRRVKERGGAVFVQNPREAAFNEMPRSAIATDLVDDVLPVAEIPARIAAYRANLGTVTIPEEPKQRPEAQQHALRAIFALLRAHTGHDFANYKRATVLRRIERRITVRDLPDLEAYAAFLTDHPNEVQALLKDLLISVTNFFRDPAAFAALEQEVLPRLFQGKSANEQVRVWVVGCATGEEAYSLAMLCAERSFDLLDAPRFQVFASDIDEAAIARAREGLYTSSDLADVSPERLRRFFTREDGRYRVRRELRETVLFANHNILKDPPFSHIDLVSCRNVLIYLNHTAQERVMETLHFALKGGGYLFLGTSESADGASDLFATVNREQHIYQQRAVSTRPLPLPEATPMLRASPPHASSSAPALELPERVRERISGSELHQQLLEQYAPPSIVVSQELTVVHVSERAGRYLQVRGEFSADLVQLVRPELRLELRSALTQALERRTNVDVRPLPVRVEDRAELVTIRVRPVFRADDPEKAYLLVLFEPGTAPPSEAELLVPGDEPATQQLEEENARLRRQLRTSSEQYEYQTEELRATNEELQALNEELRSSSEELETSKEELQSINEELRTVNQELKVKVEEATLHSTNLQNLVDSAEVGTIFLDRSLHIKLFTPAARALFNLIPADYGRPLADITHRLRDVDVLADAEHVLVTLQTVEREVQTSSGRVCVLRVLPYRVGEDRIGGVVVTFFDITARVQAEQALRASVAALRTSEEQFRRAIEEAPIPVIMHAEDGEILQISRSWTELTGYTLADVPTFDAWLNQAYGEGADAVRSHVHALFAGEVPTLNIAFAIRTRSGELRHWSFSASSPGALGDGRRFIVGMALDVTEQTQAEAALRASEARYRALATAGSYALYRMSPDWSEMFQLDGRGFLANTDSPSSSWLDTYIHPADQAAVLAAISAAVGGKRMFELEHRVRRVDGTLGWTLSRAVPLLDEQGAIVEWFGAASDVTARRAAEEQQAFLLRLSDGLRSSTSAEAIHEAVTQVVMEHLGADRCYYCEIDAGTALIRRDARLGDLPSVAGAYPLSAMPIFKAVVDAGHPFVVKDAATDVILDENLRQLCLQLEVISFIDVPVVRHGTTAGLLCITQRTPRDWTSVDVSLAVEAAERTWAALENARAEQALGESEARFRTLADTVPQLIWTNDEQGNAIYFNQRWFDYSGRSLEESLGLGWQAIVHPDDATGSVERWRQALSRGEVFESEYRLRRADGLYRWHLGRNVPLRGTGGAVIGWFGSATDIEALKQAEAARHESAVLRRLAAAQEEERLRISRDLHDQLGQRIAGLLLQLKQLEQPAQGTAVAPLLPPVQALAGELAKDAHRIAVNLRPTALEDVGLVPALERLVADWSKTTGVRAAFASTGLERERLPRPVEVALFRVAQEALTNVQKHAEASNVSVVIERRGSAVVLFVEDNGRGFGEEELSAAEERPHLGVFGMRERVAQVGGSLEIESSPGSGVTLFVRVPLPSQHR